MASLAGCFSSSDSCEYQRAIDPADVWEDASRSIVSIVRADGDAGTAEFVVGAGFVVEEGGYIVTAAHVLSRATDVHVRYGDGSVERAELVVCDGGVDVAILRRLRGSDNEVPGLPLDETPVRVGDWVAAIGSPFGLHGSLTTGVISAKNRSPDEARILIKGIRRRARFLQTDAIVHPGNSGGPLLSRSGRVVGVAVASYGISQRLGFATPASTIRSVLDQVPPIPPPVVGSTDPDGQAALVVPVGARSTPLEPAPSTFGCAFLQNP